MGYKVVLAPDADRDLNQLLDYLEVEFGERTAIRFAEKFRIFLLLQERWPDTYPVVYKKLEIRRAVIHKRVLAFYQISDAEQLVRVARVRSTWQETSLEDLR